ncbi:MAG: polysaccharide deacetylase [Thermoleophilia bacterium]|nr:polysaccharide deacetylase [Thermoleophilia bacterium]
MKTAVTMAAAGGLVAWAAPATTAHLRFGRAVGIRYGSGDARRVALTFDDGPQPRCTELVLAALERHDLRATFFVVGDHALRAPGLVHDLVARGHDVQSHGMRHRDHLLRTPADIDDDMRRARHTIGDLTGTAPALYRPPHGVVTWPTLRTARSLDQRITLWTRWGCDWQARATATSIARRATRDIVGGDTILLHDAEWHGRGAAERTAQAVGLIVEGLLRAGLTCGPLVQT